MTIGNSVMAAAPVCRGKCSYARLDQLGEILVGQQENVHLESQPKLLSGLGRGSTATGRVSEFARISAYFNPESLNHRSGQNADHGATA
jgi:hypothetical protein